MKHLEQNIRTAIADALNKTFSVEVEPSTIALQPTRKEFAGTFTFVTFPYTKSAGKGPEQIGQAVGEYLQAQVAEVAGFNVVKGFLNIEITDATWLAVFRDLLTGEQTTAPATGQKVVVEYSSPNTNKPLHLGH